MTEAGRLAGLSVLVTRPTHQADHFCRLIEAAGGKALRFPTIEIITTEIPLQQKQALQEKGACDCIIFISPNAVNSGFQRLSQYLTENTRIAAIGQATTAALEALGQAVDIIPDRANSESLLDHPALEDVKDRHIVIVRGGRGRELLQTTLTDRGALITVLDVYQRVLPHSTEDLAGLLSQTDVIAVTSNEGLQNLFTMADSSTRHQLLQTALLAGSPRVLVLASKLGFKTTGIQASSPADQAMLEALLMSVQSGEIQ